jgi:hypothetical protein
MDDITFRPAFTGFDTFRPLPGHFGGTSADGVVPVRTNKAYTTFRARLASPDPPPACAGCAICRGTF